MDEQTAKPQQVNNSRKSLNKQDALVLKVILIALLIILSFIPISMIRGIINEREATANAATQEVQQKWSQSQTLIGPVLTIPYLYQNEKGENKRGYINYLPEQLNITGDINTQELKRGLYEIIVYNSTLEIQGTFTAKDLKESNLFPNDKWIKSATLNLGISDLRGINEQASLKWNNQKLDFTPGVDSHSLVSSGISSKITSQQLFVNDSVIHFAIKLKLKGSESLQFTPLGRTTKVSIHSNCQTPSFSGAFLPIEREISSEGFTSKWEVLEFNRNYSQIIVNENLPITIPNGHTDFINDSPESQYTNHTIMQSTFGVNLLFPVDQYQKSMRSAKYAFLIIILTFVVSFFVEIFQKKNIHPLQYLLIGLALCLFYTLLVSTSEHIGFTPAYIISALMTTSLITFYMIGILKIKKTAFTIGGLLACLYAYIFSLIQLETYALLVGSIGLFVILAIIMYFSQKINWYNQ